MLEIRDLVKVYPGGTAALKGIRLEIPTGMFGLLGPNGSGKTTLMRILAGQLEPTSGSVQFDGDDIVAHPERLWPRLGYLPQQFGFYPHLSGEAMLRHLLQLKGVATRRTLDHVIANLLERVNLTDAAQRPVRDYSGGMRQRLGIAQAIAGNPALLIVDEPTAGLDPEERVRFYRLLAELASDRIVLLSTHIVEDVAVLCPRLAIIRYGRLLAATTPAEARARLTDAIFEGEADEGALDRLPPGSRVLSRYLIEGRHRVRLHCPTDQPGPLFAAARPSLEDAYLLAVAEAAEAA